MKDENKQSEGQAVLEEADMLYLAAVLMVRHRHTANGYMWDNLACAANRFDAARQAAKNSEIRAANTP